jgi:hypothetical protein
MPVKVALWPPHIQLSSTNQELSCQDQINQTGIRSIGGEMQDPREDPSRDQEPKTVAHQSSPWPESRAPILLPTDIALTLGGEKSVSLVFPSGPSPLICWSAPGMSSPWRCSSLGRQPLVAQTAAPVGGSSPAQCSLVPLIRLQRSLARTRQGNSLNWQ